LFLLFFLLSGVEFLFVLFAGRSGSGLCCPETGAG
jgi:hypothetical protein